MLNEIKIRGIYSDIQNQLFHMIPEKWDELYLYASIIDQVNHLQTGEMYFYYYPKGILRKNPVNVYEIPTKFNIEEAQYMKLVEQLYQFIKRIRQEYEVAQEELWSNVTICIVNHKFRVQYHYEDLLGSNYSSYDRHLIWQYQYLHFPLERLSKKERQIVYHYLEEEPFLKKRTKEDVQPLYKNKIRQRITYHHEQEREEYSGQKTVKYQKVVKEKVDPYEQYKIQKAQEEQKQKEARKNQILNF